MRGIDRKSSDFFVTTSNDFLQVLAALYFYREKPFESASGVRRSRRYPDQ